MLFTAYASCSRKSDCHFKEEHLGQSYENSNPIINEFRTKIGQNQRKATWLFFHLNEIFQFNYSLFPVNAIFIEWDVLIFSCRPAMHLLKNCLYTRGVQFILTKLWTATFCFNCRAISCFNDFLAHCTTNLSCYINLKLQTQCQGISFQILWRVWQNTFCEGVWSSSRYCKGLKVMVLMFSCSPYIEWKIT